MLHTILGNIFLHDGYDFTQEKLYFSKCKADSLSARSEKIMPFPTKICIKFQPIICPECNSTVLLLVGLESMSQDYLVRERLSVTNRKRKKRQKVNSLVITTLLEASRGT